MQKCSLYQVLLETDLFSLFDFQLDLPKSLYLLRFYLIQSKQSKEL